MKRFYSIATAAILVSASMTFIGCHGENGSNKPSSDQGSTAGGNGAFGENPARPGSHTGDPGTAPPSDPNSSK